jgi:hypothetical protein
MKPAEHKPFAQLLSDAMAFYRRDISRFALDVWWQACQPFDIEQVTAAFTAHAMDPERGQFAPTPADLVRVLQGTQTDRSLVAWGKVLEAIQRVGAYQSPVFDDGLIHAAVEDVGGWVAVCRCETNDLPHVQRRFCESYRAYARRPGTAFPPRLAGVCEQDNALKGYDIAPALLVGDAARARQVMAAGSAAGRVAITSAVVAVDALPAATRRPRIARPAAAE